jgi:amidase
VRRRDPTGSLTSFPIFQVIPISKTQDSVGPICANVSDVARVLQAIATPPSPKPVTDYLSALSATFIPENNIRIGVPRTMFCTPEALGEEHKVIMETFEHTLHVLKSLGAEIVDPADIRSAPRVFERGEPPEEWRVMFAEFRVCILLVFFISFHQWTFDPFCPQDGINRYLADLEDVPSGVRTLKDLIAFNKQHEKEELPPGWTDIDASKYVILFYFCCSTADAFLVRQPLFSSAFIEAEKTLMDEKYHQALEWCRSMARDQGIDAALQDYGVDVLVVPCSGRPTV